MDLQLKLRNYKFKDKTKEQLVNKRGYLARPEGFRIPNLCIHSPML